MLEKLFFKKIEAWVLMLGLFIVILGMWSFSAVVKATASGNTFFGSVGRYAVKIADFPLKAGKLFLSTGGDNNGQFSSIPAELKFNQFDENTVLPGEYGISMYSKNQGKIDKLVIVDPLTGKIAHTWEVSSEVKAISYFDSSLILMGERGYQDSTDTLLKIDANGKVLWESKVASHHSVFVDAMGFIYTPTINFDYSGFPTKLLRSLLPYRDDGYAVLNPEGKIVSEGSLTKIIIDNGLTYLLTGVGALEWDPIHLNSIKPAPFTTENYNKGDLLFSLRHLSLVLLYRPSTGKIVWHQLGPWTNQHDADFLENGNISVFGNDVVDSYVNRTAENSPLTHGQNNIYVYDFETKRVNKVYQNVMRDVGVSTVTGGSHKIYSNGDLMVHFSNSGTLALHLKNEGKNYYFGLISDGKLDNISGFNLMNE